MILRRAEAQDNQALIQFFASMPVKGKLQHFIRRKDDFFSFYKLQSKDFITFVLEDPKDKKIHGCASFVFKQVVIAGHVHKIAWATDLRISNDRRAILGWGKYFLPLLSDLKKEYKVDFFFSVLNLADTQLLNTFIRSRSPKRNLPRYHLFRKFSTISVHGKYPWAPDALESIAIESGKTVDFAELTNYLQKKAQKQILHTDWRVSTLFEKLRLWKGISIENFLIARNQKTREIVGCVLPWSPHHVQDYIPLEYTRVAENFRQYLKFGKLLGISRKLVKSIKRSGSENALPVSFLTHFYADNEDVLEALLDKAWLTQGPDDFIVYSAFPKELHMKPPPAWITVEQHFAIYCMLAPDETLPDFLSPYHVAAVELDPQFT